MWQWLKRLLDPKREAAYTAEEDGLNGDAFLHDLHVMVLGERGAADLERRLAEYYRERDYAENVERMERLVALRRRELAAKAEFDSL